jgi:hypothetical protein
MMNRCMSWDSKDQLLGHPLLKGGYDVEEASAASGGPDTYIQESCKVLYNHALWYEGIEILSPRSFNVDVP